MFTTLTIIAAWFSFGYCVTDIVTSGAKNFHLRKYNERQN
jgi:hypothetical protein